jgi:hypothetical protein
LKFEYYDLTISEVLIMDFWEDILLKVN